MDKRLLSTAKPCLWSSCVLLQFGPSSVAASPPPHVPSFLSHEGMSQTCPHIQHPHSPGTLHTLGGKGGIPLLTLKQPCPAPGRSHGCQGPSVAPRARCCGGPRAGWSSAQRGSRLPLPDLQALSEMDEFKNLDSDIEGSAKRWKKFVESEVPEKEVFPKEWKNKTALQKLCMLRCMRPDRMTYAVRCPKPARLVQLGSSPARGRVSSKRICSRLTCGGLCLSVGTLWKRRWAASLWKEEVLSSPSRTRRAAPPHPCFSFSPLASTL